MVLSPEKRLACTVREASQYTGLHENTIRAAIYQGRLKAARISSTPWGRGRWIIHWPSLLRFLENPNEMWVDFELTLDL